MIVAPSKTSNCASVTVAEPIIRFPPIVVFAVKVRLPELSPVIQVVVFEPSYVPIANCLSPVALAASTPPIITLPLPLVILSPALVPTVTFLVPVIFCPEKLPIAVL